MKKEREKKIQSEILIALGSSKLLRIWRQNTGVARALHDGAIVRYGLNGAADLSGILLDGRRLEIEVKTPTGKQTRDQRRYGTMITTMGGLYLVVRSAQDAKAQLREHGYRV